MYSAGVTPKLLGVGFPIRRSTDQRLLTAPRGLSQFCHVLHRLLVPRHPPNALTSLTTGNWSVAPPSCLSAGARCARSPRSWRAGRWPSRSSTIAVDFVVFRRPSSEVSQTRGRRTLPKAQWPRQCCLATSGLERFRTIHCACSCFVQLFDCQSCRGG